MFSKKALLTILLSFMLALATGITVRWYTYKTSSTTQRQTIERLQKERKALADAAIKESDSVLNAYSDSNELPTVQVMNKLEGMRGKIAKVTEEMIPVAVELQRLKSDATYAGLVIGAILFGLGIIYASRLSFSREAYASGGKDTGLNKEGAGTLRSIIVLNQVFVLGIMVIQLAIAETSVLDSASIVYASKVSQVAFVALPLLSLAASAGLFVFQKWSKFLFLLYFVLALLVTAYNLLHFYTRWTVIVSVLSGITGILILVIIYLSPAGKLFEEQRNT